VSGYAGIQVKNMNEETREAVVERDRGQCQNCKISVGESGDVHHIVPRGVGGATVMSNLVLLCRTCHDAIHDDETTAPTVHIKSTGYMSSECFSNFLRFVRRLPSAQFVEESKMWRIPKANFERFLDSTEQSDENANTDESDVEEIEDNQTTLGD
jgi:hypothetical protein